MGISPDVKKMTKISKETASKTVKEYEARFVLAVQLGQTEDVKAMLALGVSPNCRATEDAITPMHIVASTGNVAMFDVLYETKRLDLNSLSSRGTPAITIAVSTMRDALVEKMANRGANVDLADRHGMTPLHYAVYLYYTKIMKILLMHGCSRNPVDLFFSTPLSIAAIDVGSLHLVKMLVEYGANINFDRGPDLIPLLLEICLRYSTQENLEIVEFLLESGANINVTHQRTGRNVLHMVAITNNVALAKILIKHGAHATLRDDLRFFPYEIAQRHKNEEVADILEEAYARQS